MERRRAPRVFRAAAEQIGRGVAGIPALVGEAYEVGQRVVAEHDRHLPPFPLEPVGGVEGVGRETAGTRFATGRVCLDAAPSG